MAEQTKVWTPTLHKTTNFTGRNKIRTYEVAATHPKPNAPSLKWLKNSRQNKHVITTTQIQAPLSQSAGRTDKAYRSVEEPECGGVPNST